MRIYLHGVGLMVADRVAVLPVIFGLALLTACSSGALPPPPGERDADTDIAGETSGPVDTASSTGGTRDTGGEATDPVDTGEQTGAADTGAADSADTDAVVPAGCPPEMSAIAGDDGVVRYCIDTYEVVLSDPLAVGTTDQYGEDIVPPKATAQSLAGELPAVGVSYGQAVAICANTPVFDGAGEIAGYKRLPTTDEWRDAADGVVGEGGLAYPYGDVFDEDACACTDDDDDILYADYLPAGSFPRCVSPAGVFDQSGNIWEWSDPGRTIERAAWWSVAEPLGLLEVDGYLGATSEAALASVSLVQDADGAEMWLDSDGRAMVSVDLASLEGQEMLLIKLLSIDGEDRFTLLPIQKEPLDPDADVSDALLRVMVEWDGHPLAEKVGGAHYVRHESCRIDGDGDHSHHHAFNGTIGFRCVAEPLDGGRL